VLLSINGHNDLVEFTLPECYGGMKWAPAVFHWLRRKRSHLAIAEMVRAEFVKFDQELPAAPEPE
jgi:hypothetical protein